MDNDLFKDIFINKKEVPRLVIDSEKDSVIQSFINDCKPEIDSYLELKEEDVKDLLNTKGRISTIEGEGNGEKAVNKSIESLINNFEYHQDIKAILIRFYIHETFPVMEFQDSLDYLFKVFEREEEIIFSILIDNTLAEDCVHATSIIQQQVIV